MIASINGITLRWSRLVMCFGLSDEQIDMIKDNLPTKSNEIYRAECFTDIVAMPQMVAVTVWERMSEEDRDLFIEFFSDIAPFSETIVVIGEPELPNDLEKHVQVYESFDALAENIKYVLLSAYKKKKRNEDFSSRLSYALIILEAIRTKPYVTTKQLADALELSPRSIQRYIETLRVAGEWIEYDTSHKGWVEGPGVRLEDDLWATKVIEEI